jgi:hypothetical protein
VSFWDSGRLSGQEMKTPVRVCPLRCQCPVMAGCKTPGCLMTASHSLELGRKDRGRENR